MALFTLNVVVPFWNPRLLTILGSPLHVFDFVGLGVSAIFLAVFTVCSVRDAKELDARDRAARSAAAAESSHRPT